MAKLHSNNFTKLLKRGLRASLHLLATESQSVQGEMAYTTNTKQLFVHDGTGFKPVQSLDMAVVFEGEVVTHNNLIVYSY